jgi:hypothetical protein
MSSTERQRHGDTSTTVSIIRGMVLSQAAGQGHGEGVRTEVPEDVALDRLEVRLFIGSRSTVICFAGIEVAKVLGDAAARRAAEARIGEALSGLTAPATCPPPLESC